MTERMRQLAGKLEIQSKPKSGTLVIATLPMARIHASASKESAAQDDDSQSDADSETSDPTGRLVRKRILIADDREMVPRGGCTALQKQKDWEICAQAVNGRAPV